MGSSTFFLICNSFCYFVAFGLALRKRGWGIYSFVWLFYAILSVGAIYLFNIESIWNFNEITLFPLIYLFVTLALFMKPIYAFSAEKTNNIIMPSKRLMKFLSWGVIVVYLMLFVQTVLTSFSLSDLFNSNVLAENYANSADKVGTDDGVNIWGVLKNVFSGVIWLAFMYNWVKGNKILTIGLLFALVVSILFAASGGSRGGMARVFVDIPFMYFAFRKSMTPKMKKVFFLSISTFIAFGLIGFIGLTVGRYGDSSYSIFDSVVYYASSNFIMFDNYALDANGVRYGDRTFPLIRLLLGLDITGNYLRRREVYSQMTLNDSQFSTFIGEFLLDYGPVWGFIILMLFSSLLYRGTKAKGQYHLSNILIFSLVFRICVAGYSLFSYSEVEGNLSLLYILFFYIVFRYSESNVRNSWLMSAKYRSITLFR